MDRSGTVQINKHLRRRACQCKQQTVPFSHHRRHTDYYLQGWFTSHPGLTPMTPCYAGFSSSSWIGYVRSLTFFPNMTGGNHTAVNGRCWCIQRLRLYFRFVLTAAMHLQMRWAWAIKSGVGHHHLLLVDNVMRSRKARSSPICYFRPTTSSWCAV